MFSPPEWETEGEILFHAEDVSFELTNPELITRWLKEVIEQAQNQLRLLNFIFCSDEYLHKINLEYLQHDTYTDIITFPLAERPIIEGDIFISIDRVKENATVFEVSFEEELYRVMAHGVWHLCGYGDKTDEEAAIMRRKENEALEKLAAISSLR
ncbi:MAG: rRNA maturation RNase YbeY [Bacteroidetes bacterium]|nr:MAG: rRNA maturation RNase YbeY [Bacteroidota bacterium]